MNDDQNSVQPTDPNMVEPTTEYPVENETAPDQYTNPVDPTASIPVDEPTIAYDGNGQPIINDDTNALSSEEIPTETYTNEEETDTPEITTSVDENPEAITADGTYSEDLPYTQPLDTSVEDSSLTPPKNGNGANPKLFILIGITALLFIILIGAIWFFFLRDKGTTPTPTPTPTATIKPTTIPGQPTSAPGSMHLECRFGLCVEIPGEGADTCATSFDCEQAPLVPTDTPIPTITSGSGIPTVAVPTNSVSPTVKPTTLTPTITTKPTITTTISPTIQPTTIPTVTMKPSNTPSPTPLTDSLPISGTTNTTIMIGFFFILLVGAGVVVLRKT